MEYGKIVEPPFTSILLAKNCEAYESPIEHGMFGGLSDAELIEMNTAIELSLSRERTSDRQVAESLKKLVGAELYRRTERRKNNTIEV